MRIKKANGWNAIPLMRDALRYRRHLKDSSGFHLLQSAVEVSQNPESKHFKHVPNVSAAFRVWAEQNYKSWVCRDMRHLRMAAMYDGDIQIAWVLWWSKVKHWRFTTGNYRHQGIYHRLLKALNAKPGKMSKKTQKLMGSLAYT